MSKWVVGVFEYMLETPIARNCLPQPNVYEESDDDKDFYFISFTLKIGLDCTRPANKETFIADPFENDKSNLFQELPPLTFYEENLSKPKKWIFKLLSPDEDL